MMRSTNQAARIVSAVTMAAIGICVPIDGSAVDVAVSAFVVLHVVLLLGASIWS